MPEAYVSSFPSHPHPSVVGLPSSRPVHPILPPLPFPTSTTPLTQSRSNPDNWSNAATTDDAPAADLPPSGPASGTSGTDDVRGAGDQFAGDT